MPRRSVGGRNDDGSWTLSFPPGSVFPAYAEILQTCLNTFDSMFTRAKAQSEFEFVCTLLRVGETRDAGWDTWETLNDVCDLHQRLKTRRFLDSTERTHLSLFVYGQILEASEPYELLANLLNVIEGDRFKHTNFSYRQDKNGRWRAQHYLTKIDQLKSRASRNGVDLSVFDRFVDNNLRNAVFHSDYSIHWPDIRVVNRAMSFSHSEWMTLVNGALASCEALRTVHGVHVAMYDRPKTIMVNPAFSGVPGEKADIIIRRKHGVIGMKSHYSRGELAAGAIPFQLARLLRYEGPLIDAGRLVLPPNRIDRINRLIRPLPEAIRRRLVKSLGRFAGL